jgi:hypothetical protein
MIASPCRKWARRHQKRQAVRAGVAGIRSFPDRRHNLSFQQNTKKFQIAVVVLVAGSTQLNKTFAVDA